MRIRIILYHFIMLMVFLTSSIAESASVPNVLILHSYHHPYRWTDDIMDGMMQVLLQAGDEIDIYTEYLDAQRIPKEESWPAFENYLKAKYRGIRFDVILASDDDVLDFLITRYESMFPGVPIVFCGINNLDKQKFKKHEAFKGISQEIDAKKTIEMALKLFPDTENFLVLSDRTSGGMKNTAKFREDLKEMGPLQQKFHLIDDFTLEELKAHLQALGPDDLVLVLRIQKIKGIDRRDPVKFLQIVTDTAPVPAFKVWGNGKTDLAGGVLVSASAQGKAAAEIALRILAGEDPQIIQQVTRGPNIPVLNYAVLQKFNIDEKDIPEGTTITNRPISILENHPHLFLFLLMIFILLILIVLSLLAIIFHRRKSDKLILQGKKDLSQSEAKYRLIVENQNELVIKFDNNKKILYVNPTYCKTFGIDENEILEKSFVPLIHEDDLEAVERSIASLSQPPYATYHEERGKTVKGWRWFAWSLQALMDENGNIEEIVSVGRDITELKNRQQALTKSESSLREAQEIANLGNWEMDVASEWILWSDENFRIFGIDRPREGGLSRDDFMKFVHPDDRALVLQLRQRLGGEGRWEFEYRVIRPNGEIRWISERGKAYFEATGTPTRMFGTLQDITDRKNAEIDRERLMSAISQAGEAIVITNVEGNIEYVNPAFEKTTGYTREEATGRNPRILKSGKQDDAFYKEMWETLSMGETWKGRLINRKKDGTLFTEEVVISPVFDEMGKTINYVAVKRDITHELELEAQLVHAQKLESIGRLAGGVAHDYNNALSVIIGYTELADNAVDPADPLRDNLDQIHKAANRAADITRQLLAFARKQTISPKVIDLNENVEGMLKMLNRLIGENISLLWTPGKKLYSLNMDPTQIDQILANLCVNARDAISDVGKITIETSNTVFDKAYCTDHSEAVPGKFVLLEVSDNGCGMEPEILNNIFEPFFTTKGVNEGTGLGLATVYGIVKQNEGFINVYSELGMGSTFKIYLPRHAGTTSQTDQEIVEQIPLGKGETVLLVEDDLSLLKLARKTLDGLGYNVLQAGTPEEAIRLAENHTGEISLLLTDVIMPEMNGQELSKKLKILHPELKPVFMSGYTADVIAHHGVLDEGVNFIQKPFSKRDLGMAVRHALDEGKQPA